MKLVLFILLYILPISIFSQEKAILKYSDTIINVEALLYDEFGAERIKKLNQIKTSINTYSYGILELNNILENDENLNNQKILGNCQCTMAKQKIQISNAIGFRSGVSSVIEIDLESKAYESKIYYSTDGVKRHKFKTRKRFVANIIVPLNVTELVLSSDSKFEHNGIIKGVLTGTSIKYYEEETNEKGYKEVQLNVRSIFECKLKDFEMMKKELQSLKEQNK